MHLLAYFPTRRRYCFPGDKNYWTGNEIRLFRKLTVDRKRTDKIAKELSEK